MLAGHALWPACRYLLNREFVEQSAMASQLNRPFVQEPESFVHALLGAQDISTLAFVADGHLRRLGLRELRLIWNHAPGDRAPAHLQRQPPDRRALELARSRAAPGRPRNGLDPATWRDAAGLQVLAQNTGLWVALSARIPVRRTATGLAGRKSARCRSRCQSLLYTQRLQVDVERLANAERLQRALFAISDIASSDQSQGRGIARPAPDRRQPDVRRKFLHRAFRSRTARRSASCTSPTATIRKFRIRRRSFRRWRWATA